MKKVIKPIGIVLMLMFLTVLGLNIHNRSVRNFRKTHSSLLLYSAKTGKLVHQYFLDENPDVSKYIIHSRDLSLIVYCCQRDQTIHIWNLKKQKLIGVIKMKGKDLGPWDFVDDEKYIVVTENIQSNNYLGGSAPGPMHLFTARGKFVRTIFPYYSGMDTNQWPSVCGKWLIFGGSDQDPNHCLVYDVITGEKTKIVSTGYYNDANPVKSTFGDGETLIALYNYSTYPGPNYFKAWNLKTQKVIWTLQYDPGYDPQQGHYLHDLDIGLSVSGKWIVLPVFEKNSKGPSSYKFFDINTGRYYGKVTSWKDIDQLYYGNKLDYKMDFYSATNSKVKTELNNWEIWATVCFMKDCVIPDIINDRYLFICHEFEVSMWDLRSKKKLWSHQTTDWYDGGFRVSPDGRYVFEHHIIGRDK